MDPVQVYRHRNRVLQLLQFLERDVLSLVQRVSFSTDMVENVSVEVSEAAEQSLGKAATAQSFVERAADRMAGVHSAGGALQDSTARIQQQVERSNTLARQAVEEVAQSGARVQGLQQAAESIGGISGVIQELARQTNLLALNATIEAMRAGDAGRGFAVVAEEVKRLAHRTAEAAADIQGQISSIQTAAAESGASSTRVDEISTELQASITAILSVVEEQQSVTGQIGEHVQSVASEAGQGVMVIGSVTERLNVTQQRAAESLSAASSLKAAGVELSEKFMSLITELKNVEIKDRRAATRMAANAPTRLKNKGAWVDCTLLDVSATGAGAGRLGAGRGGGAVGLIRAR